MIHSRKKQGSICLGLLMTAFLAGCGGGGGSSSPALGPLQVSGAIQQTPARSPQSGYTVTFDQNAKVTATTDVNGSFTLTVPRSAVTGTDTLSITDPSGALVSTVPVPANTTTLSTYSAGTVSVSPPGAPPAGSI